jgi:curved DNA-binding protein CbpA
VFPTDEQFEQLQSKEGGDFRLVPFGVLLRWLWEQRRTCTLEIRRGRLWKRVALENGSPVACESNLAHERFGRYLVEIGRLSDQQSTKTLSQSITRDQPFGEVLVEEGILEAEELLRLLQQCLGKQLLDGFSWTDGEFSFPPEPLDVPAPLKMKVPQLVLTGTTRFAPQTEVDSAVMTLIGTRLATHPFPMVPIAEIRLSAEQERLLQVASSPRSLIELAEACELETEEISRNVYALGVVGLLVTEDALQALSQLGSVTQAFDPPELAPPRLEAGESVTEMFLAHRRRDAFDLLSVSEDAAEPAIRQRFLEFARRYAPWQHDDPEVREQARELFLAGAIAYTTLVERQLRDEALARRHLRLQKSSVRRVSDLIDARECFADGLAKWRQGELEAGARQIAVAAELDPQNSRYRAEAAFTRAELDDQATESSLGELFDVMRFDADCRQAFEYGAELAERLGKASVAADLRARMPSPGQRSNRRVLLDGRPGEGKPRRAAVLRAAATEEGA